MGKKRDRSSNSIQLLECAIMKKTQLHEPLRGNLVSMHVDITIVGLGLAHLDTLRKRGVSNFLFQRVLGRKEGKIS